MLGSVKLCYTCLAINPKDLFDVSTVDSDDVTYLSKLRNCISSELDEDQYKQICAVCVKQLRSSYRFKQMVLMSQETLNKHQTSVTAQNANDNVEEYDMKPKNEDDKGEVMYNDFGVGSSEEFYLEELKTAEQENTLNEFLIPKALDGVYCGKCNVLLEGQNITHHTCDELEVKGTKKNSRPQNSSGEDELFECLNCGLAFSKKWQLRKHMNRMHSNNKRYVCTYCNKAFKQSYHLREHLTSHTGERNHTCTYCGKTFQRLSSMRRHIKSHQAAPGHKTKRTPFLCTVCGKSFPFSNGVQRHMRIHLGIKNHECQVCLRRFTQSTHLHVHMRTHTGEKPYVCETCGESFSLNASLQKHLVSIHQNIKISLDDL